MTATATDPILDRYRDNAKALGARFQQVSPDALYAPVSAYIPSDPARVLDVGAGSGRDAAWLAGQGHRVVAVEPVEDLARQAASLPDGDAVEWITDHLPDLSKLGGRHADFDLILLSGVWHHLDDAQRVSSLSRLEPLMRRGGHLIISLRHGSGEDADLIFSCDPDVAIAQATSAGLRVIDRVAALSVQPANAAAGVTWTWLVFQRPVEGSTQ